LTLAWCAEADEAARTATQRHFASGKTSSPWLRNAHRWQVSHIPPLYFFVFLFNVVGFIRLLFCLLSASFLSPVLNYPLYYLTINSVTFLPSPLVTVTCTSPNVVEHNYGEHNLFIHSRIYKVPLQEIYSEAAPTQPRRYKSVLKNLQNALSLFIGRRRISKGSLFQVEEPTMENARRCLVAVVARGTNSWSGTEERRGRLPGRAIMVNIWQCPWNGSLPTTISL